MKPAISVLARGMAETLIFCIVSGTQLVHYRIHRIRCRGPALVCLATEGDGRERNREGFGLVKDARPFRRDHGIHL